MSKQEAILLLAVLAQLIEEHFSGAGSVTFRGANPIIATEGNEVIFEWRYSLSPDEQSKFSLITFGKWRNYYIDQYLVTVMTSDESVIPEPTMEKTRPYYIRRFSWVGDLTQSHVAFRLSNVTLSDVGNYGCFLRFDNKENVSKKAVLNVKSAPPLSSFTIFPPERTAVVRHHSVHFKWEYSFNDLDRKAFKALVWGRYTNNTFEPLYTVNSRTTQVTDDPRYAGQISIQTCTYDSGCSFRLSRIEWLDQGKYEARLVKDNDGILLRSSTSLFVLERPRITKITSKTKSLKENGLLILTCKAQGVPIPKIVWKKDENVIPKHQGNYYIVEKVKPQDSGRYTCMAKNEAGSAASPEILVNVKPKSKCEMAIREVGCFTDAHTKPRLQKFVLNDTFDQRTDGTTGNDRSSQEELVCQCAKKVEETEYTYFIIQKGECWSVPPEWNEGKGNCTYYSFTTSENTKTYTIYALPPDEGKPDVRKSRKDVEEPAETFLDLNKHYTFIISLVAVAVAVAVLVVLLCVIRRHHKKGVKNPAVIENIHSDSSANAPGNDGEFPRNRLIIDRVVGIGAFGVVCRGHAFNLPGLSGWTTVAIKTLSENARDDTERKDLLSELRLLKNMKAHPHVIKLLGYVTSSDSPMVVIEYVPNGDLLGYLRRGRGAHDTYYNVHEFTSHSNLTSRQLLRFAWQISDGMDFLSSMKVIHRDLAARNVLVGEGGQCKITDFGMARNVCTEDIYFRSSTGRIPLKWTAIEAITGRLQYSTKSDVWSFGVVLYEIFTIGGEPFPGICVHKIIPLLTSGIRMAKPRHVDDKLYSIMLACWNAEPENRPTFASLRATIKALEARGLNYVNV